ncbi:WD40 repeat-like protein [Suillus hirtellus]|nr:WD40 repeat-like protein [Suillus hirtellus]
MSHSAPAKHENLATMPYKKIKVEDSITEILHLPGGQRIITRSYGGPFRVWDLGRGIQVEEWEDKFSSMALSPDSKTLASVSWDGAVKLWSIDTGKVIKTLTEHTESAFVCWSPDGGRVLGGSKNGTFRVWDVKSGRTILGPIQTADDPTRVMPIAAYYSPDGKMIATTGEWLEIWDGNTGELLKTFESDFGCLAWTSNGKTLTTWRGRSKRFRMMKFDTATWTVLDVRENLTDSDLDCFPLSPDERFFAATSFSTTTVQLWNIETNQPIGTPLHHKEGVMTATFSQDGKFLITSCMDRHIYMWDVSAILVDVTPQPAPGAPRIPPGFFDDALREANSRIRPSQSHGPHNHSTPTPHQRILSPFSSFWRRSNLHGGTEHHTRPLSHYLNWTRNLVSGMLRRRDGSDIELREVEVPYTAGKPRNFHARKKPTANSSRPPIIHPTHKPNASSSQLPPATTASTLSAAGASGTPSRPHITIAGWRARFVGCICCMPIQNADGHH